MSKSRREKFIDALSALCDLAELSEFAIVKILLQQADTYEESAIDSVLAIMKAEKEGVKEKRNK